jgi:hypothetical protein
VKTWETEPSNKQWEAHGYKCEVKRVAHSGHLCGYVTIPDSHPWFGISYRDNVTPIANPDMDHCSVLGAFCFALQDEDEKTPGMITMDCAIAVHGGITYGDNVGYGWTLGFDCAHSGDLCPVTEAYFADKGLARGGDTYRDMDYVTRETEALAEQLRKVEERGTR